MRKFVLTIAIILCFAVPAKAIAPLAVIPLWVLASSAVIHVAAAAAGLYYAMKSGGKSKVSGIGEISRPSEAVWIDAKDMTALSEKNVSAKMDYNNALGIANQEIPSKYPLSKAALDGGYNNVNKNNAIGDVVNTGFGQKKITAKNTYGGGWGVGCPNPMMTATYSVFLDGGTDSPGNPAGNGMCYYYSGVTLSHVSNSDPVPPGTPQTFNEKTRTSAADNTVASAPLQAELDKMFQDPNYVPTFTDDSTGLPFAPPSSGDVATPTAVTAAVAAAASAAASAASTAASAGAVAAAGAASASAGAAAAASPGNAGLAQAALDAAARYEKAKADAATAAAAAGAAAAAAAQAAANKEKDEAVTAPDLPGDNVYTPFGDADKPVKKSITELLTGFIAGAPLVAMVRSFVMTASGEPVVAIGTVYGKELTFDFTRYGSTFSALGGILLLIVHGFAILVVFRGW